MIGCEIRRNGRALTARIVRAGGAGGARTWPPALSMDESPSDARATSSSWGWFSTNWGRGDVGREGRSEGRDVTV